MSEEITIPLYMWKERKVVIDTLQKENAALIRERDEALAQVEALSINVKCACGYDNADDVCLVHTKMKAEARAKAFDEAVAVYETRGAKGMEWDVFSSAVDAILALKEKTQ